LHFHHPEQWEGIRWTSGGGLLPGTQAPKGAQPLTAEIWQLVNQTGTREPEGRGLE
jgi:hypothetical protein